MTLITISPAFPVPVRGSGLVARLRSTLAARRLDRSLGPLDAHLLADIGFARTEIGRVHPTTVWRRWTVA